MNWNSNDKFFFKGKFFQSENEFFKFCKEWALNKTDEETFYREWEHVGKDIWMNIVLRKQEISNGDLVEILQDNFLHILNELQRIDNER